MRQRTIRTCSIIGISVGFLLTALTCQAAAVDAALANPVQEKAKAAGLNPQPLPPRPEPTEVAERKKEDAAIIIVSGKPARPATRKSRKGLPLPAAAATSLPQKVNPPSQQP